MMFMKSHKVDIYYSNAEYVEKFFHIESSNKFMFVLVSQYFLFMTMNMNRAETKVRVSFGLLEVV